VRRRGHRVRQLQALQKVDRACSFSFSGRRVFGPAAAQIMADWSNPGGAASARRVETESPRGFENSSPSCGQAHLFASSSRSVPRGGAPSSSGRGHPGVEAAPEITTATSRSRCTRSERAWLHQEMQEGRLLWPRPRRGALAGCGCTATAVVSAARARRTTSTRHAFPQCACSRWGWPSGSDWRARRAGVGVAGCSRHRQGEDPTDILNKRPTEPDEREIMNRHPVEARASSWSRGEPGPGAWCVRAHIMQNGGYRARLPASATGVEAGACVRLYDALRTTGRTRAWPAGKVLTTSRSGPGRVRARLAPLCQDDVGVERGRRARGQARCGCARAPARRTGAADAARRVPHAPAQG